MGNIITEKNSRKNIWIIGILERIRETARFTAIVATRKFFSIKTTIETGSENDSFKQTR